MKKITLLLFSLFLVFKLSGQAIINTSLQSCTISDNTLDFDIYITNASANSASNFILQSGAYGLNFNYAGMSNGGEITIAYLPGTSQLIAGQAAFNTTNTFIGSISKSIRINAQVTTIPATGTPLTPGTPIRVGTFRLTNSTNWATGAVPNFSWISGRGVDETRTSFTVYLNGAGTATGFSNTTTPALTSAHLSIAPDCSTVLSIKDSGILSGIEISPNPASSFLQIITPDITTSVKLTLTDVSGKEISVRTIDKTKTHLSLTNLDVGMYFLKFDSGGNTAIKKFVKL